MISFNQFINLKEALSLDDPLAQSTLKIKNKKSDAITFEFTLDNNFFLNKDNYQIDIFNALTPIRMETPISIKKTTLDSFKLMYINLTVNGSYSLTNQMGMKANTVYNMLLNAIKQAHDHFGEANIDGYYFSGANNNQDLMYERLMKRFAPNLITWNHFDGTYLKPEAVQKLKDQNPNLIDQINDNIHKETSQREMQIQQSQQNKKLQRSLRRQQT
jgi:hypothetical protein